MSDQDQINNTFVENKPIDHSFRDWEGSTFGFGYGTGEEHTIPALKQFLELCKDKEAYDYVELETALTPAVAWLLINVLCKADIIEYGTSPRYGWLTDKGKRLKGFVGKHTADELYEIAAGHDENYISCYPDACNCGESGYVPGRKCPNPFWS